MFKTINLSIYLFLIETDTTEGIALYDYKGRTEKEITFKKGDRLTIKGQLSADWWLGAHVLTSNNSQFKYGYIPDKYIALRNKNRFVLFSQLDSLNIRLKFFSLF